MDEKKFTTVRHEAHELALKAAQRYDMPAEKCHLGHIVLEGMLQQPDKLNQIDASTDKRESNISVARRSMRLAKAMSNSGLKVGDAVIIMAKCHLDLVVPYYACHFNGYSVSGIDPRIGAVSDDLNTVFLYMKPKIVFCDKTCEEKLKDAFDANNMKGEVIVFENDGLEAYIQQHNGTDVNFRPADFDQNTAIGWLILTSGTTGAPKAVAITYKNMLNSVCCWWDRIEEMIELCLTMGTLHWLTSYVFFVSSSIRGCTKLQSSESVTTPSLIDLINKYRPNSTIWLPHLLKDFLTKSENCCDLSCFKHIGLGGAHVDQDLIDRFKTKFPGKLDFTYGQSEILVPIFDAHDNTPPGAVGRPSSKYQFRLVAIDGSTVDKPNTNGELWIKGDEFFEGYLNNPEETKKIYTEDGWLQTGDVFCRDEQNFYYFVERKNLLIRYICFLLSPLELEELIRRHPGVQDVCVVGIPHPDFLDLPVAAIVKKQGHDVDPQEIFDLLKGELDYYKQLHGGLFFVDNFIYTPSGKINRANIKDLALIEQRILPKSD